MRQKLTAAALVLLLPSLASASGFALFEHGNRGMAMAGAFVAVADDPSALFWNPAGIAFQTDKGVQLMGGAIFIFPEQSFLGDDPFPGAGYRADQVNQFHYPAHAYLVYPLNDRASFGLSLVSPFGLGTWWEDDSLGRFISKRTDIMTFELSPHLAFALSDALAVGFGVDYRVSTIDVTRNVESIDPFAQRVVDVGQVHMFTEGLGNDGWGWHASVLAKLGAGLSFGALYRSTVKIEYEGKASFTQYSTGNPQLDALVALSIPFDTNPRVATRIEFPEFWSVGLAWRNEKWTVSGQYGAMGWEVFKELPLIFPNNPEFSTSIIENYEDADQYRLGLEYRASETWAFQFGALFDETPQPPESMSPLLGDGDRTGYCFGIGWRRARWWVDVGYMYISLDERSTRGDSLDGFEGTYYDSTAHLIGASVGYRF